MPYASTFCNPARLLAFQAFMTATPFRPTAFGNALGSSIVEQMQSSQRDELIRQIHEGTDARSRLAQAVLKSDVRPEEAVKIAGAMAERFGEEGLGCV